MTNKGRDERVRQHNQQLAINYMRKVEEDLLSMLTRDTVGRHVATTTLRINRLRVRARRARQLIQNASFTFPPIKGFRRW